MSSSPDCDQPLATQPAAPSVVPPRRPIVGTAMADDDHVAPLRDLLRRLDARARANQDALARLLGKGLTTETIDFEPR